MYKEIYNNLCTIGKTRKNLYKKGSNFHKHHIIPKHSNGDDINENYTFLTIREHIIAHYLLWKLNKNPYDLGSMHMLGAHISSHQRKIFGEWCRDNKIGFHSFSLEMRKEIGYKSWKIAQQNKNEFFYWSTQEGRLERARLGGKASFASGNNKEFLFWCSKEGSQMRAKMGGLSSGKLCVTNGVETKKFKTDIEVNGFIDNNPSWKRGRHWNPKGMKNKISSRRRKVTDGETIYESVQYAAKICNVTPGAIVQRCKSKKSKWKYL